jgi:hypothetical protein
VSVIVLQTQIDVFLSHAWAFEYPTISSAVLFTEDVFKENSTPENHPSCADPNTFNIIFRKSLAKYSKFEIRILCWKQSECILRDRGGIAYNGREYYGAVGRDNTPLKWGHENVNSGGDPVIFSSHPNEFIWFPKIIDPVLGCADVGHQLSLLSISGDAGLRLRHGNGSGSLIYRIRCLDCGPNSSDKQRKCEKSVYYCGYSSSSIPISVYFIIFFCLFVFGLKCAVKGLDLEGDIVLFFGLIVGAVGISGLTILSIAHFSVP